MREAQSIIKSMVFPVLSSILSWPGLNGGKAQSVSGEMGSAHTCLRRPLADAVHETLGGVDSGKNRKRFVGSSISGVLWLEKFKPYIASREKEKERWISLAAPKIHELDLDFGYKAIHLKLYFKGPDNFAMPPQ